MEVALKMDPFPVAGNVEQKKRASSLLLGRLSTRLLIEGKTLPPAKGKAFNLTSPVTGEVIGHVADADLLDVRLAVASAVEAQKKWAKVSAQSRGVFLKKCVDLLSQHKEELASLLTFETGKAIRTESRPEVESFINMLSYYAGLGLEIKGNTTSFSPNTLTMTIREPMGVVGAIIPWNVPLLIMAMKIAPALMAGNSVVVKSSELAPFSVLRAAEIMSQILPPGLLNVLSGIGKQAGSLLVEHPDIAKITFTGSVETGKIIASKAGEKLIPVTLELGGKSPMIVCPDADLNQAVQGAVQAMRFTRQGQSCTAASRLYVHEKIYDAFFNAYKDAVDRLKIGDPFFEETDIGTVVSHDQYTRIKAFINKGRENSEAMAHYCSELPLDPSLQRGYYLQPVIFAGLDHKSALVQEEIFGPVACLFRWSNFDEVIDLANKTRFGLAASIWTRSLKMALRAVHEIKAGFVQVNQHGVVQPGLSFGGFKESGMGKEATLEAMTNHFTLEKTIIMNMD